MGIKAHVFYKSHDILFFYEVGHHSLYPSSPAPAPLSNVRTHSGTTRQKACPPLSDTVVYILILAITLVLNVTGVKLGQAKRVQAPDRP